MTAELIHQMYIAYYQRPADPAGLAYWQAQLTANGGGEAGWNAVAAAFANAAESSNLYGTQTLEQKISAIYLAAFERAAVDSEVTFWANSGFTEAQIAFAIVNGAQNDDLSTVSTKVTYATNFVAAIDPAGTGVGPFSYEYNDPSAGRTLLDAITKDSDVSTATVNSQVSANIPTLVTVNLTSGQDTVTPTTNAVEHINAALGGTAPSLGRTDQIDGGDSLDTMTISTDGNFLLGFSSGFIKNVETLNLNTTITSVTTKLINLTGVSGVTTYNVGASMANVKMSEMSDVGGTINVSGLSTGTFDVGFASGAISASGSAMTMGISDVGSTGDAVQLITQGVTDLTIVGSGVNNSESFVNLGNTSNEYQTISVIGSSDLFISDVGSAASALLASSFSGDLDFTLNASQNEELGASGKTISGGAGTDTMRLQGSAQVKAATSSIEELLFEGTGSEVTVKASGMVGVQTLTFSGQGTDRAINISGLESIDRTINATLLDSDGTVYTQVYSAGGDLTVNLNTDPTLIAQSLVSDNDFTLTSRNTGAVTMNVGSYVSAAGTHTLSNATTVTVSVDSTSLLGGTIKADKASSFSLTNAADVSLTLTALAASTISLNVGSGTVALGSTALSTLAVVNSGSATISAKASGVTTITVDAASMADLSSVNTTGLQTLQVSGAGSLAAAKIGAHSGVSTNLTMSITGMEAGFSAGNVNKISSDITIGAANSTGALWFDAITASGVTVSTGTIQDFHADAINAEKFTFDGAAATSTTNSANIGLGFLTASSTVTISLGAGTGIVSAGGLNTLGAVTFDGSNFEGTVSIPYISGSGITVSLGTPGAFSATTISSDKAFTLDGSNAASSTVSLATTEASTNITLSLGSGSGTLNSTGAMSAGGSLVIDGSKSGASMDVFSMTASGATVSLGSTGDFSATQVNVDAGGFTLDGAAANSAAITLSAVSASAAVTISLGAGSGALSISNGIATSAGAVAVDGSNSTATLDLGSISASGVTVVTGSVGDVSASLVDSTGGFTIDASKGATAQVSLTNTSVSGAVTISLGSGTGALSVGNLNSTKSVTVDAGSKAFGGSLDIQSVSGSGVTISLGLAGNLSAATIQSTKTFTLDGAASVSSDITFGALEVASGITVALGTGSGNVSIGTASSAGSFTLDASNSKATIDVQNISGSGVSIVTGTSGDFSAATIIGGGGFTLDASNATGSTISFVTVSVGNTDSTISLGGGTGSISANLVSLQGDLTIDMSKSNAAGDIASISASGITISLGAAGNFSANLVDASKTMTLDGSAAVSADLTLTAVSAEDAISITVAGSANVASTNMDTVGSFTFSAAGASESVDITDISASGISITTGLQGDLSASAINSVSTITVDASGATTAQGITMTSVSASGAISITLGAGSGTVAMTTAESTEKAITISGTRFDGEMDVTDIQASGLTVSLGSGGDFSASSVNTAGGFTFNAQDTDASGEQINLTNVSASGVSMNMGAASLVSVQISALTVASGDFNFSGTNFNGGLHIMHMSGSGASIVTGANFIASAQSVVLTDNFTLNGAALTSASLTFQIISASGSVAMSFGAMTGDLVIGKISTLSDITLSGENANGLGMTIGDLSASGISVSLGEVSDTSNNFSASVIDAQNFTMNATNFRDSINLHHVSAASAVTITVGDTTDDLTISSLTSELFTLNGGDGDVFSATISSANIGGSAWTISMPEMGGGLKLVDYSWSGNGTIRGTDAADVISASATMAAGVQKTIDIDLREDSAADLINLTGTAGATYAILRNFDSGEDKVGIDATAAGMNNIAITAAAAMITTVLGTTLTASDIASAATSLYTYNSDTYFVSDEEGVTGSFGNGDFVIRFVGVSDILHSDISVDA